MNTTQTTDLSEGFMLYSGFHGGEESSTQHMQEPTTPRARRQFSSSAHPTPTNNNQTSTEKMGLARPESLKSGNSGWTGFSDFSLGRCNEEGIRDEMDEVAYSYALKVTYINRILKSTPKSPLPSSTPRTPISTLSPSVNLTSPSSYFPPAHQKSPSLSTPAETPSRGLWGKKNAPGGTGGGKFGKEFLIAFWDVLGNEGGDSVWRSSVNTFLSYLSNKKATKTSSGLNLREIPVLLETFGSVIPANQGGIASPASTSFSTNPNKHVHITHLIALLQTSLQGYYNPMNRKVKEDEKEMYLKIMIDLENWSLAPAQASSGRATAGLGLGNSPFYQEEEGHSSPSAKSVSRKSSFLANISSANQQRRAGSPPPPLPSTPSFASSSNVSLASGDSMVRTPLGDEMARKMQGIESGLDLVDVVRRVFGVSKEKIGQDLEGLKRAGLDEKNYLSDLKLHLVNTNADPSSKSSPILQERARSLQAELSALMHARPDLAGLHYLNSRTTSPSPGGSSQDFDFTPNQRKDEVYCRLVRSARITLGYDTPLVSQTTGERELVELCAGVWGIQHKTISELETTFEIWSNCLGQEEEDEAVGSRRMMKSGARKRASYTEEFGWAERVLEDLLELALDAGAGLEHDEEQSARSTLATLFNKLTNHLTEAISTIYPTTAIPPSMPPPSCFGIITALLSSPELSTLLPEKAKGEYWQETADELRGAAVGEYVGKQVEFLEDDGGVLGNASDKSLEGHEKLADFIDDGIKRVGKVWPQDRLDGRLYPPAVILSRQLPLFLAELQTLDQPSSGSKADVIFGLYERTARLMHLWEDFCPGEDLGFDLDAFFEPHVREWLRGTNEVDTHEWVSRAVAMDSWVPEGHLRHSQSVLDLFQFIRSAVTTILVDLPLGEYSRACYLIDFSKTASASVCQYASTVEALFMTEMTPVKANSALPLDSPSSIVTGKAGAWLAKSKQAIQGIEKGLDRKKAEGFVIPPTACVKLTNMGAAKACLEDLMIAMEADESARIVKEHNLKTNSKSNQDKLANNLFTITVSRGEDLLSKGLSKPADSFVTITDRSNGHRLFKSNTVLGQVDPSWEETFELGINGVKALEVTCWDRSLVGKHDNIGSGSLKLDPSVHRELPVRELLLPLNPRGGLHVRVEMQGGEKHEVRFHLDRAGRTLERSAEAMTRCIVDRMSEFIKTQLSSQSIKDLLRPLSAKPKKGVAKQTALSEQDYEQSLVPLFDYFDSTFSIFAVTLTEKTKVHTMTQLWRRVIDILISLLIPPLSNKESTRDPLSNQEINVVFQWLKFLKSFFNACEGGIEHGVPLLVLQSGAYKDLLLIGQYLDLPLPALKEKCAAAIKGVGRGSTKNNSPTAQSGFTSINNTEDEEKTAEILLRILRMRPQTSEFLGHQISALNDARVRKQTLYY